MHWQLPIKATERPGDADARARAVSRRPRRIERAAADRLLAGRGDHQGQQALGQWHSPRNREEVEAYVVHHVPYDLQGAGYVIGNARATVPASPVTRRGAERMRGLLLRLWAAFGTLSLHLPPAREWPHRARRFSFPGQAACCLFLVQYFSCLRVDAVRPRTGRAGYRLISISLLSRIAGDPALDIQAGIGTAE